MTEMREQPHGMKVIHVQAFVPGMRRAVMTGQLDGTVVKDRVDACGLDTYYEVHGAGEPLLYLHGGFNTIEMLGGILPQLAQRYRVYLPERQGQGRTPDRDGPVTFQSIAAETIPFLEAVGRCAAHLGRYGDSLLVNLHDPLPGRHLAHRPVLAGPCPTPDGSPPFYAELME